jgi:DNA-binding transcriptional ArsR family regulator
MEDSDAPGTDPFSDLASLRIPQDKLQNHFAEKTHDSKAVSNLALKGWGISRDAKRRALIKLANAGLIEVESRQKRSPRVTILSPYAKDKAKAPVGPCSGEVAQ